MNQELTAIDYDFAIANLSLFVPIAMHRTLSLLQYQSSQSYRSLFFTPSCSAPFP